MALSDFILNSDYPTDMIVFIQQGTRTVPAGTFGEFLNIPHGLPFRPLPYIIWSLTPDFAETYLYTTPDDLVVTGISCLGANITVEFYNYRATGVTIYWRLYAFPPSTATLTDFAPATASQGDDYLLNSDNNYLKLVNAGVISTTNRVYTHNLGYVPTVLVWLQTTHDPYVYATTDRISAGTAGIKLSPTTIEFVGASINDTAVEYRLYGDD